jgi:hypothetical protein
MIPDVNFHWKRHRAASCGCNSNFMVHFNDSIISTDAFRAKGRPLLAVRRAY